MKKNERANSTKETGAAYLNKPDFGILKKNSANGTKS